jgi:hypothetical protein
MVASGGAEGFSHSDGAVLRNLWNKNSKGAKK